MGNNKWMGAAAVCLSHDKQVLLVLQGKTDEPKTWSVPSGGRKCGESLKECCQRETREETGYQVRVGDRLFVKRNQHVQVHYFTVEIVGGSLGSQDPDGLIHQVAWKSLDEIDQLELSFPEDRDFLVDLLIGSKW